MRVLTEFPHINDLFQLVFLQLESEKIQQIFSSHFLEICKKLDKDLPRAMLQISGGNSPGVSSAAGS